MKDYKKLWKSLATEKSITAGHVYQRCLLKAVGAKSEDKKTILLYFLKKAFTPISRATKLRGSGVIPYQGAQRGWNGARFKEEYLVGPDKEPTRLLECIETQEEVNLYKKLYDISFKLLSGHEAEDIEKINAKKNELYSFVFVRQDISVEQQMVQAMHVFGKACHIFGGDIDHLNLVLCGISNLEELNETVSYLDQHRFLYTNFHEPDINNELTAISTLPIRATKRGCLRKFKTLTLTQKEESING